MAENGKFRQIINSILLSLLTVSVLTYAVIQLVGYFSAKVEIARLRDYSVEEKITSECIFFRDEQVVLAQSAGSCDYAVDSGSKVAIGDKLVMLYSTGEDAGFIDRLNELEMQIANLKEIFEAGSVFDFDINRLDEQINETIDKILLYSEKGNAALSEPYIKELAKLMNKRAIIGGSEQVTQEQINALQSELDGMTSDNSSYLGNIYANFAGYFVTDYDAGEKHFPTSLAEDLSVADFNELMSYPFDEQIPSDYIGVIIDGFEWCCALTVPEDVVYSLGSTISLRFPGYSDDIVNATVYRVSEPQDGQRVIVVKSLKNLGLLMGQRTQSVEIITEQYSGLWVSKDAVNYVDGVTGVYVLKGRLLTFTPIEIVYSADEYILITAAQGSSLVNNDDVVISGRDLYDGKVVTTG